MSKQEAQLPLSEHGVSFVLSSHNTTHYNFFFEFSCTLRVRFLKNLRGNGCMHVNKNSTRSSFTRSFYGIPAIIRIKCRPTPAQTRVHAEYFFVVNFYDNFNYFKGLEDMATHVFENWKRSTTPLSINASSRENLSEYPHKPYIARN